MNDVTVIIPNYNGIEYIENCLRALQKQSYEAFQVLLVDNGSEDESLCIVQREFPEVKVVALDRNYGFSRAVNEGLKRCNTPFVILLNNDTEPEPEFVEYLSASIKKNKNAFSVAAKMLQLNYKDKIDDAGDLYCALGWAFALGKDKPADYYNKKSKIFSSCAGAAIYRREVFDVIGNFDEFHFAYLEDVDVGYRARIMGYENLFEPKALVYHVGSAFTGSRYNEFKIRLASRNSIYIIYKNMPGLQILLNFPFLCIGFFTKACFFIAKGYGREYLSGFKWGYFLCTKGKKFPYSHKHLKNYVIIQLELWLNMLRRIFG